MGELVDFVLALGESGHTLITPPSPPSALRDASKHASPPRSLRRDIGEAEDILNGHRVAVLSGRVLIVLKLFTRLAEEVAGDRRVLGHRPAALAVTVGAARTQRLAVDIDENGAVRGDAAVGTLRRLLYAPAPTVP